MSFATSNSRVKRLTQKKSSTAKKNNPEISDASSVGSLNVREDFVAVTEERDIDSLGLQTMQNLRRMMDQHNVETTRQRSLSKSKSISPVKKMSTKNVMNKTQTTAALRNLDTTHYQSRPLRDPYTTSHKSALSTHYATTYHHGASCYCAPQTQQVESKQEPTVDWETKFDAL